MGHTCAPARPHSDGAYPQLIFAINTAEARRLRRSMIGPLIRPLVLIEKQKVPDFP